MKKIININIPIIVTYDIKFDIAAKVFSALIENELLSGDLKERIAEIVEVAKVRSQIYVSENLSTSL